MNILKSINDFFNRKSRVQLLEEDIADMKKRIFKKEKDSDGNPYYTFTFSNMFGHVIEPKPIEEDFFDNLEKLENKIDAIAKHLKVRLETKAASEEEVVARPIVVKKLKVSKKK